MFTRILLAGLIGGVAMFIFGAATHLTLPATMFGVHSLPNDAELTTPIRGAGLEHGFYVFPATEPGLEKDPEALKEWTTRMKAGPIGVVIYDPAGQTPMSPMQLLIEFITNALAATLGAFIAQRIVKGFGRRFLILTLLGPISWLTISAPHWNWYHFPADFTIASLAEETLAWMVTAIAISIVLAWKKKSPSPVADER